MDKMDLSLVPIHELSDEIMKRGDVGILMIHNIGDEKKGFVNWVGDYYKALGLCVDMQRFIIDETYQKED